MENVHLLIIVLFLILFILILKPDFLSKSEVENPEPKKEGMMVKKFDFEKGCKYGVCASQFVDNNIINYGDSPILNSSGF